MHSIAHMSGAPTGVSHLDASITRAYGYKKGPATPEPCVVFVCGNSPTQHSLPLREAATDVC